MYSPIKVSEWVTIQLNDSGKYGIDLQEGWVNRSEEFKPNFCKREFGKQGAKVEKNVPVSIKLGEKEHAIEVLEALLWQLKNDGSEAPF